MTYLKSMAYKTAMERRGLISRHAPARREAACKSLIARFGSFAEAVSARPERLREIEGLGEAAIVELKSSRRRPSVS